MADEDANDRRRADERLYSLESQFQGCWQDGVRSSLEFQERQRKSQAYATVADNRQTVQQALSKFNEWRKGNDLYLWDESIKRNWSHALEMNGVTGAGKSTLVAKLLQTFGLRHVRARMMGLFSAKDDIISVNQLLALSLSPFNTAGVLLERGEINNWLWRAIIVILHKAMCHVGDFADLEKFVDEAVCDVLAVVPDFHWTLWRLDPRLFLVPRDLDATQKRMIERNSGADVWRASFGGYLLVQQRVYGAIGVLCGALIIDSIHKDFSEDCLPKSFIKPFSAGVELMKPSVALLPPFPQELRDTLHTGFPGEQQCLEMMKQLGFLKAPVSCSMLRKRRKTASGRFQPY